VYRVWCAWCVHCIMYYVHDVLPCERGTFRTYCHMPLLHHINPAPVSANARAHTSGCWVMNEISTPSRRGIRIRTPDSGRESGVRIVYGLRSPESLTLTPLQMRNTRSLLRNISILHHRKLEPQVTVPEVYQSSRGLPKFQLLAFVFLTAHYQSPDWIPCPIPCCAPAKNSPA
jgi:hypothetical protein